jgi:hypothetical protein
MEHLREGTSTEEAANFDSGSRARTGRVETLSLLRGDQGFESLFLRWRVRPMNRVDASRMGLDLCRGRPAICGRTRRPRWYWSKCAPKWPRRRSSHCVSSELRSKLVRRSVTAGILAQFPEQLSLDQRVAGSSPVHHRSKLASSAARRRQVRDDQSPRLRRP